MLLFATIVAASGLALWAQQNPGGRLERKAHVVKTFDGREFAAELGRLAVPETRSDSRTNSINLAFIRLPSRAPKPGPPIVFLMGGPRPDCREVASAVSTGSNPSCSLQISNVRFEAPPPGAPIPVDTAEI